ncbi:hypothetical protein HWV62_35845 [Athelia sp. TMB]|nr:hypothetical protein HWV62_35845 [Athelia sp. TMB]
MPHDLCEPRIWAQSPSSSPFPPSSPPLATASDGLVHGSEGSSGGESDFEWQGQLNRGMRGKKRIWEAAGGDSATGCDMAGGNTRQTASTAQDEGAPRLHAGAKRVLAAIERDLSRNRAATQARVMGHNWTPDCNRAGDRPAAVRVVAARYLDGGELMIPGSDGLTPDPRTAHDGHRYTSGSEAHPGEIPGYAHTTALSRDGFRDIRPNNAKQSQRWTVAVGKVSLLHDAVSPMAKLSVVATCAGQRDLIALADLCGNLSHESLSLATAVGSSLNPIAQISKELGDIRIEARVLQLRQSVKCMQLLILVEREFRIRKDRNLKAVHRECLIAASYDTFRTHQLAGFRLLELASGVLELRRDFSNLTVTQTTEIAKAFRIPPPDVQWNVLMTKVLIPRLRWLQVYGVPTSFVNQLLWNPDKFDSTIRCYMHLSDLEVSDKLLGEILMNSFVLPSRQMESWTQVPPKVLPSSERTMAEPSHSARSPYVLEAFTVVMPWDFATTKCPVNEQVSTTSNGTTCLSGDFVKKYPYIAVPSSIISEAGKSLIIRYTSGRFLAMVCTHAQTVLQEQCKVLLAQLMLAYPDELFWVNSATDPNYRFFSEHFSWYNRYYEQGDGAPKDVHPDQLLKEGKLRANLNQRIPRESLDIRKHPDLYYHVSALMKDILEFIRENIAFHMPQQYKELEVHCDFLPLHDQPPGRPFTSMVVNLGAVTKGHRDGGDKTWCGTFTVGDCKGGQICFYEAGLVLESRPSDFISFESQEQTHFNLHIEGIRGSIVLHSDRTMDSWSGDGEEEPPYNRWGSHVH